MCKKKNIMSVTYTSTTGNTVTVGEYAVTVTGLQLENSVDVLDKLVGVSLSLAQMTQHYHYSLV